MIALLNLFYYRNMLADNIIWARDTCELLQMMFGTKETEELPCDKEGETSDCGDSEE